MVANRIAGDEGDDQMLFKKNQVSLYPWAGKEPIYEYIRKNIDSQGNLPVECDELPDSGEYFADQQFRWAGGAMDSLFGGLSKEGNPEKKARRLFHLLCQQMMDPSGANRRVTYSLAMKEETISYVDLLLDIFQQEYDGDSQPLKREARWLVTQSAHRGPVKLGIALLGMFQRQDELEVLYTVGKHDEFTLYAAVAIQNGVEDSNHCLFEMAKHVEGWGKIHLVAKLEPESEEIETWLLKHGCENRIVNSYLAYPCAIKGRLDRALQAEVIDQELYRGAGVIIDALLEGGPAEDIDDYSASKSVITDYLRHSENHGANLGDFLVLANIRDYLEQDGHQWEKRRLHGWSVDARQELLEHCHTLIRRDIWPQLVWDNIDSQNGLERYRAIWAGRALELDVWPNLLRQLEKEPLNEGLYYDLMRSRDPERIQAVVDFAEDHLPLEQIAAGPRDELGLGPEYKPNSCLDFVVQDLDEFEGIGKRLISAALWSPVTRNRNIALRVLEAWRPEFWPEDARTILERLKTMEPNEDTREQVLAILEKS